MNNYIILFIVVFFQACNWMENSEEENKNILLSTQKDPLTDNPQGKDIYKVGILANVLQMLKLPDGTVKVLVEGAKRVKILK